MVARADLEVGRTGDGAARIDQVGRLQRLAAVLALVASSAFVAAVGLYRTQKTCELARLAATMTSDFACSSSR